MSKETAASIKAVFVQPPAEHTAHAALMFQQQGIAIIEVADTAALNQLATSQCYLLDEQQGIMLTGDAVPIDKVQSGWIRFSSSGPYSLPDKKTEFNSSEHATLKKLLDIPASNSSAPTVHDALNRLRETIQQDSADRSTQIDNAIADLIKICYQTFKLAEQARQPLLNRITNEVVVDLVRLSRSIENNETMMDQLYYYNWINMGFNQHAKLSPDAVDIVSISSQLSNLKLDRSFDSWLSSIKQVPEISHGVLHNLNNKKIRAICRLLFMLGNQLGEKQLITRWQSDLKHQLFLPGDCLKGLLPVAARSLKAAKLGVYFPVLLLFIS